MDNVERYQELKDKVATMQADVSKAEGALEHIMHQLKESYGCATITAAKKHADELAAEAKAADKAFNVAMDNFKEEWGEVLERAKA